LDNGQYLLINKFDTLINFSNITELDVIKILVFSISHLQEIKHNIIIERYIRSIFSYLEETYKVSFSNTSLCLIAPKIIRMAFNPSLSLAFIADFISSTMRCFNSGISFCLSAFLHTFNKSVGAIKQREVDERIELVDEQVLAVIRKMVKQRKDSISQFKDAGRTDLIHL
jgi:hypothetical protein